MKEAIVNQAQGVIDRVARYAAPVLASMALAPAVTTGVAEAETAGNNGGTYAPIAHGPKNANDLRSINQLSGYSMRVSQLQEEEQAAVTVKLGEQPYSNGASNPAPGEQWCTGLNVDFPGTSNSYVLTNAHCFETATGQAYGVFYDTSKPPHAAENYIGLSGYQYSILDPEVPSAVRGQFPMGIVDGLSIDTSGVDAALLNVVPDNGNKDSGQPPTYKGEPPYSAYPAISFDRLTNSAKYEEPGQQVAMDGIPAANGNKPIKTTGRYLGRYVYTPYPNYYSWPLDLVAVKAESPFSDACQHGSSGGSAELADGDFLGGLNSRFSTGYGPTHFYAYQDTPSFDKTQIKDMEKALKVKVPEGDTVCGFTVLPQNVGYTLLSGFNTYYSPPNSPLKGGGGVK
jgi:hypothetical protein